MPREPMLFLLAFALLLNLALLLGVALIRLQTARPRTPEDARRPLRPQHRPAQGAGVGPTEAEPVPATEPLLRTLAEPPPAPVAESTGPGPVSTKQGATNPVATPSPTARRARRFVLPKLEEDRGRAERAIQAVLGEGPSTQSRDSSAAHRPRRRSRRHRPSGPVDHTSIDVAVRGLDELGRRVGPDAGDRLIDAVRGTIHAHLRSGDRTIDLGEGRLRLIVETDAAGAASAVERLRGLTAPWLAAAAVPLSLRMALPTDDAVDDVAAS